MRAPSEKYAELSNRRDTDVRLSLWWMVVQMLLPLLRNKSILSGLSFEILRETCLFFITIVWTKYYVDLDSAYLIFLKWGVVAGSPLSRYLQNYWMYVAEVFPEWWYSKSKHTLNLSSWQHIRTSLLTLFF